MNIHVADPQPGRCRNYRWFPAGSGYDAYRSGVRCNGYEGTDHVCWFTPPVVVPVSMQQYNQQVASAPNAVPWVEPERQ